MRLEWLAEFQKESNQSILQDFDYDPSCPWYALSLAQRRILAKAVSLPHCQLGGYYPLSTRTTPKITCVKERVCTSTHGQSSPYCKSGRICIPAEATITPPSENVIVMPSFNGGHQVFLGKNEVLDFELPSHWLPPIQRKYRLWIKVATAHVKDVALLISIVARTDCPTQLSTQSYRLPLPYSKALWAETERIEITLNADSERLSIQREWTEFYGTTVKEIWLQTV
jgi:hypothetical protein